MKKVLINLFILLASSNQLLAQTQTQDLNMNTYQLQFLSSSGGNNRVQSFGGSGTTGSWLFKSRFDNIILDAGENSSNNRRILFHIGGIEKARFHSNGNFGIGTTNPAQQLHITKKLRLNWNDTNTSSTDDSPTIYASGQGASYPFSGRGNLILQTRATNTNGFGDLVVMTGQTATPKFVVRAGGNVGIGTTNPASKLEVNGDISLGRMHKIKFLETISGGDRAYIRSTNGEGGDYNSLIFAVGSGAESLKIKYNGNVGIGVTNPSEKLQVAGTVHAMEVKVDLAAGTGPDYVFEPDYDLRTLKETKEYITQNKHLPEIPPAKEMEANGVELGDMNMRLLKKIEELTLYQIELLERLESVEAKNEEMQKELEELKTKEE